MTPTTRDIAEKLVALLRQSKNVEAIQTLYDDAIQTYEADPARTRSGKAVVLQSMQGFADAHTFHYTHIDGPLVSGSHFVLRLRFEATSRATKESFAVDEIGVYEVKDGRIVREQFFHDV